MTFHDHPTSCEDLAFPPTAGDLLESLQAPGRVLKGGDQMGEGDTGAIPEDSVIFAIDPGTEVSGWCLFNGTSVLDSGVADNSDLLGWVRDSNAGTLAIEMVSSYGMPVGREVFETVRWIGRFQQAWRHPDAVRLIYRKDVKQALCHSAKAKDANIRQALLDRFARTGGGKIPQVGTKSKPGPLYGVSSHAWSALAVAVVSSMGVE